MKLEQFLDDFLGNILCEEGLINVKETIKKEMKESELDFNTTKVESQVFNKDENYEPRVEISSEGYDDGEIIFIDYHLD